MFLRFVYIGFSVAALAAALYLLWPREAEQSRADVASDARTAKAQRAARPTQFRPRDQAPAGRGPPARGGAASGPDSDPVDSRSPEPTEHLARLHTVMDRLRAAVDNTGELTEEERRALFAEAIAAYDHALARTHRADENARQEVKELYPELRELMARIRPRGGLAPPTDDQTKNKKR